MSKQSKTTRFMAYAGFFVATAIAVLAICLNRDLTGAGVLTFGFLALTGVHGARQAYKEGKDGTSN